MAAKETTPTKAAPPEGDLSREIVLAVERQHKDDVRCTRVTQDTYRCNWWAPAPAANAASRGLPCLQITTQRVRMSRYLRATKTDGKLVIEDLSALAAAAAAAAAE